MEPKAGEGAVGKKGEGARKTQVSERKTSHTQGRRLAALQMWLIWRKATPWGYR